MDSSGSRLNGLVAWPTDRAASRDIVTLTADLLPLADILILLVAGYLSTLVYATISALPLPSGAWALSGPAILVGALVGPFILYDKQFGNLANGTRYIALLPGHALRFSLLTGVILILRATNSTWMGLPVTWLALWLSTSLILTGIARLFLARQVHRLEQRGMLRETIAIVGAGPIADRLVRQLQKTCTHKIQLLGVFDDKVKGAATGDLARTGSVAELIELGKTRKIDWIVMTLPSTAEDRLQSIVQRLKTLSVPIGLCPPNVGLTLPCHNIDYVSDRVPVTLLADRPIRRWGAVLKSAEDFILGGIITLMLLPIMLLIALIIRLDSPGPIIFKQRRHTFNNSEFDIYKFRSMRWTPASQTAELKQTTRDDDRVTRVGRFLRSSSLDELPQLFNVLKGQMSLVGPRPHAINMRTEDRLGSEIVEVYAHRHRVKPGITGWSQVNGARGATHTIEQLRRRIELDLYYVENWSLWLDFKILVLTVREVIKRTNAY